MPGTAFSYYASFELDFLLFSGGDLKLRFSLPYLDRQLSNIVHPLSFLPSSCPRGVLECLIIFCDDDFSSGDIL